MSAAEDLTRRVHDAVDDSKYENTVRVLDAKVLADMVDDVLNRHRDDGTGWCEHCCAPSGLARQYPCPERVALDRIAKEAQP